MKKPTKKQPELREDYPLLESIAKPCDQVIDDARRQQARALIEMWARMRSETMWGTWDTLDHTIESIAGKDTAMLKRLVDAVMEQFDDGDLTLQEEDAAEDVAARIIGNYNLRYFDKAA